MKSKSSHILWIVGTAALLVLFGVWLNESLGNRPSSSLEYFIVERFLEIPSTTATVDFKPVKTDTLRQAFEDSLLALAIVRGQRDSLAREALREREAVIEDTISVADSLGSFYARAIHELKYDGAKNKLTKTTTYADVKLKTVNTKETIVLEPSLWDVLTSGYALIIDVAVFIIALII